ncbi:MAG: hypothetical protein WCG90_08360 [Chitinophagia bacterium]
MQESFEWGLKCIRSCNGHWQLETANNMISLFESHFGADSSKLADELRGEMISKEAVMAVD